MSLSAERRESLEVAPQITSIFWESGKPFNPARVDHLFNKVSMPLDHEVFGKGHHWKLGSINGLHTGIDFYPQTRALNLKYRDPRKETQPRFYIVDTIGIGSYQGKNYVAFLSERDMTSEIVLVAQDGNFAEFHQRLEETSLPAGTNTKIQVALNLYDEAKTDQQSIDQETTSSMSELQHKRPQDYSPEDVLGLFKLVNSRNKKKKDLRLQAEISDLVKVALTTADLESLHGQERLALRYLELRFVERLNTTNVAKNLGYSREHASKKIQPAARHLLYTLLHHRGRKN